MELPSALYKAKLQYGKAFLLTPALLQVLDKYCAFHEVPDARDILKYMIENLYHVDMINLGSSVQDCEAHINRLHLVNGYDIINIRYVYESLAYALGQTKTKPLATTASVQEEAENAVDYISFKMISDAAVEVWDAFVAAISDASAGGAIVFNLYFDNSFKMKLDKTPDESDYSANLKMMLLADVKTSTWLSGIATYIDVSSKIGLAYFIITMKIIEESTTINYENYRYYLEKYKDKIQFICDGTEQYCRDKIHFKKTGPYYFTDLLGAQIVPKHFLENYENSINKLKQKILIYGNQ